jgi:hypothetical protein
MPTFELIPAKRYHCGQIIRRLRRSQAETFLAMGLDPHAELWATFSQSSFKRAWLIDGRLAGICGVTGSLASSTGMAWAALSAEAARYPKETTKTARRVLDNALQNRHELFASVFANDHVSVRWARFLEFEPIESIDGVIFMRRRSCRNLMKSSLPIMLSSAISNDTSASI